MMRTLLCLFAFAASAAGGGRIFLLDRRLHARDRPLHELRTRRSGTRPLGSGSVAARIGRRDRAEEEPQRRACASASPLGQRNVEPLRRDRAHRWSTANAAPIFMCCPAWRRAAPIRSLRDTIVYLTCLHESGHALGLVHTRAFADIMYSFQYGGDITAYFERYRVQLKMRADIACAFRDLRRGPHRPAPGTQSVTDSAFHHCEKLCHGSPVS